MRYGTLASGDRLEATLALLGAPALASAQEGGGVGGKGRRECRDANRTAADQVRETAFDGISDAPQAKLTANILNRRVEKEGLVDYIAHCPNAQGLPLHDSGGRQCETWHSPTMAALGKRPSAMSLATMAQS